VNNYVNSNPWITIVILLLIVAAGVGLWRRYGKKNGLSWPVYGTYFAAAIVTL
jgi:LPXTG-motif cell wall-anchored protein